ncbi:MAG: hypothetical protein R3267_04195 [Paenisporosarcina sp.]|nr:hypothetical protein [Paenisporosarcina sp.]
MLYKIEIDWKMRSPHLKVVTGEVRIDQLDFGRIDRNKTEPTYIKKEIGSLEYRKAPAIIHRCKPIVDVMIRSYFDGMNLSDESVTWFNDCHRHNNEVTFKMTD